MPVYAGVLSDDQVDSLVLLFIKALADEDAPTLLVQQGTAASGGRVWQVDDFRDELLHPLRGRSFEQGKMVFLGRLLLFLSPDRRGKGLPHPGARSIEAG